jgi:hypothetical protein
VDVVYPTLRVFLQDVWVAYTVDVSTRWLGIGEIVMVTSRTVPLKFPSYFVNLLNFNYT